MAARDKVDSPSPLDPRDCAMEIDDAGNTGEKEWLTSLVTKELSRVTERKEERRKSYFKANSDHAVCQTKFRGCLHYLEALTRL